MSLHFVPQHAIQFFGGGGSAPKPPKFKPINIDEVSAKAKATDVAGFQMSDADYAKRFPDLVAGRQSNIDSSIANLQGQQDPQMAQALASAGLSRNLGTNEFQKARSLGQPILSLEQRDRDYFSRMLGDNPQRTAGLSGQNVAQIALSNATGQNAYQQGLYGSGVNAYNANIAQNAANTNSLISSLGSLAGAGIKGYSYGSSGSPYNTNFLSNQQYGNAGASPMGLFGY